MYSTLQSVIHICRVAVLMKLPKIGLCFNKHFPFKFNLFGSDLKVTRTGKIIQSLLESNDIKMAFSYFFFSPEELMI